MRKPCAGVEGLRPRPRNAASALHAPNGLKPYGQEAHEPWAGPHSTLKAALIEWITVGNFKGKKSGSFIVNESGVASATS